MTGILKRGKGWDEMGYFVEKLMLWRCTSAKHLG